MFSFYCVLKNRVSGVKLSHRRPHTVKLPNEITLELRPRTNRAWCTVQSLAQNPRLRTRASPNRRLSGIVRFLESKWKSQGVRAREAMGEKEEVTSSLRLFAPASCELTPWNVSRQKPAATSSVKNLQKSLGFDTYMTKVRGK